MFKKKKKMPTLSDLAGLGPEIDSIPEKNGEDEIIELTDVVEEYSLGPSRKGPGIGGMKFTGPGGDGGGSRRKPSEKREYRARKYAPPKRWFGIFAPAPYKPFRMPWIFQLAFFLLPIIAIPLVGGFFLYQNYLQDLPSTDALKNYAPKTVSYVYSDDGRVIGEFYKIHRLVVPLGQIPPHVVAAFLAAEDANFFNHPGLDMVGIFRAMIANYKAKKIVQGASTITQQVTRSFLLTREKTMDRKIREALLAFRIEQNLSKEEILYLYLNQIYLGRGSYGVESAAQRYFGKHVGELSIAEAALIAGMARAPGRYSPFRTPKLSRTRQLYVIHRMVDSGFISQAEGWEAEREVLRFKNRPNINLIVTPGFTEQVRREVEALVGDDALYHDGLRIYATVNVEAQEMANKAVKKGLADLTRRQGYQGPKKKLTDEEDIALFLEEKAKEQKYLPLRSGMESEALVTGIDKRKVNIRVGVESGFLDRKEMYWATRGRSPSSVFKVGDVLTVSAMERDGETGEWAFKLEADPIAQAALVCVEAKTGKIKAAVGGRDWNESQFNRAVQARRQPGSSFKPFVYAAAMDSGFTQASIINDVPTVYKDTNGNWSPRNYGRGYSGAITLFQALIKSVNVVAVKLNEKVGPEKVIEYAHRMGIKSELGPNLSLALGTSEVTPLEMASAFSTFANLGEYVEPTFLSRIEDRNGKVMTIWRPRPKRAISPETAYIVLDMMRNVVRMGTGARVRALGRPVAGKTGTTNDHIDAWFVGFTPNYSTSVWVGKDEHKPLGRGEQGGRTAAPIFLYFMKDFLKNKPVQDFPRPKGIVRRSMTAVKYGDDDDEGGVKTGHMYLTFKKGEIGRGRSELPKRPPGEKGTDEAPDDIEDRLRRQIHPTTPSRVQAKANTSG